MPRSHHNFTYKMKLSLINMKMKPIFGPKLMYYLMFNKLSKPMCKLLHLPQFCKDLSKFQHMQRRRKKILSLRKHMSKQLPKLMHLQHLFNSKLLHLFKLKLLYKPNHQTKLLLMLKRLPKFQHL